MAPISQYDSRKLRILSFALIVMVVYVHSYYVEAEDYGLAYAVQRFVGRGLCMVAVAVGVAKCLERLVPPLYRLLTGGR